MDLLLPSRPAIEGFRARAPALATRPRSTPRRQPPRLLVHTTVNEPRKLLPRASSALLLRRKPNIFLNEHLEQPLVERSHISNVRPPQRNLLNAIQPTRLRNQRMRLSGNSRI